MGSVMDFLVLYLTTGVIFLVIDAIGLTRVIRPHFETHVGHILVPGFRILPAAAFYLFYIGVLVFLVSWPALSGTLDYGWVFIKAALIGAVAYGTYEFTNLATLKPWHWSMVALDLTWGTIVTAVSVTAGLYVAAALV